MTTCGGAAQSQQRKRGGSSLLEFVPSSPDGRLGRQASTRRHALPNGLCAPQRLSRWTIGRRFRALTPRSKRSTPPAFLLRAASSEESIAVMSNGLPGNMAAEVAAAVLRRGHTLVPYSLTGPGVTRADYTLEVPTEGSNRAATSLSVQLVKPAERDARMADILRQYPALICVDYTHPSAVNVNAEFYQRHRLDFVMGTTGGDRERLLQSTRASGVYAVIAPNMAKQIVAFQAMIDILGREFPGCFAGYRLQVSESHQATKADTSGTAKAVVAAMVQRLGVTGVRDERDIERVREPDEQVRRFGVPREHLQGHAFHTYRLVSPDESVAFEFQHNVCGRRVYADGTVDAVEFVHRQRGKQAPTRVYDMMDVLRSGKMQ